VNLDYDKDRNLKTISDLKDIHWLDRGSRLCLVEFNLFNENTDIFQSVKWVESFTLSEFYSIIIYP